MIQVKEAKDFPEGTCYVIMVPGSYTYTTTEYWTRPELEYHTGYHCSVSVTTDRDEWEKELRALYTAFPNRADIIAYKVEGKASVTVGVSIQ